MPLPTLGARFGEASLGRGQAPRATHVHSGELSERALGVAMLAPMVLVLLLVVAYPLADSLWLSLHRVNLANPEQGQPLAMIFPWALLTVSNGVLWAWILNPTYGVANALLVGLGVLQAPKAWLSDTFWTMHVVILADAWKMVPTMTLLLLAGLQPISPDLYEAAEVDGATRWQKFSRITLPLLRPVMLVAVVLQTIGAFRVFDIIYVLTGNGGPADSTKVISFYAYDQAFHYLFFGYGAAISWLITACMLVLIVIYMHWLRTEGRAPVKLGRLRRRSRGGER